MESLNSDVTRVSSYLPLRDISVTRVEGERIRYDFKQIDKNTNHKRNERKLSKWQKHTFHYLPKLKKKKPNKRLSSDDMYVY